MKRDWRRYSAKSLMGKLSLESWDADFIVVQAFWNYFESKLLKIVDEIAPLAQFKNNRIHKDNTPMAIRNKINIRKRLLRNSKQYPSNELRNELTK